MVQFVFHQLLTVPEKFEQKPAELINALISEYEKSGKFSSSFKIIFLKQLERFVTFRVSNAEIKALVSSSDFFYSSMKMEK